MSQSLIPTSQVIKSNQNPILDFGSVIGGSVSAIAKAQVQSSLTTMEFIDSVGFDDQQELLYTSFKYPKLKDGQTVMQKVEIPVLSLLQIPNVMVKEGEIDFNVRLGGVALHGYSDQTDLDLSPILKDKGIGKRVGLKTAVTNQKRNNIKIVSNYSFGIKLLVVNEELPEEVQEKLFPL